MAEIIYLDNHRPRRVRQRARHVMTGRARASAPPNRREQEALEEAQRVLDRPPRQGWSKRGWLYDVLETLRGR